MLCIVMQSTAAPAPNGFRITFIFRTVHTHVHNALKCIQKSNNKVPRKIACQTLRDVITSTGTVHYIMSSLMAKSWMTSLLSSGGHWLMAPN